MASPFQAAQAARAAKAAANTDGVRVGGRNKAVMAPGYSFKGAFKGQGTNGALYRGAAGKVLRAGGSALQAHRAGTKAQSEGYTG